MNDADALGFAAAVLPELTDGERQFVLAVCRFETNYGQGWVGLAKKLGSTDPGALAHVNNWGAITAKDPGKGGTVPAFFARDRWWRIYDSPEAGLKDAASIILKPNVRAALKRGDGSGAVHGMAVNGYFIEPEASKGFGGSRAEQEARYRTQVTRNYDDFIRQTGAPGLLSFTGSAGRSFFDAVIAAGFVGGLIAAIVTFGGGQGGKSDG